MTTEPGRSTEGWVVAFGNAALNEMDRKEIQRAWAVPGSVLLPFRMTQASLDSSERFPPAIGIFLLLIQDSLSGLDCERSHLHPNSFTLLPYTNPVGMAVHLGDRQTLPVHFCGNSSKVWS